MSAITIKKEKIVFFGLFYRFENADLQSYRNYFHAICKLRYNIVHSSDSEVSALSLT